MGIASFSGPGAGRYPTANSVVNDLVRLGVGKAGNPFPYDKVCAIAVPLIHFTTLLDLTLVGTALFLSFFPFFRLVGEHDAFANLLD